MPVLRQLGSESTVFSKMTGVFVSVFLFEHVCP